MAVILPSPPPLPRKLPLRLTPFIGRQADLEALLRLLRDPSVRLVTILGAGGIGKTALALEVARLVQADFQHGAVFVPLARLNSIDELLPALAVALGVQLAPVGDLQQTVQDHLAGLHLLLIFDSFEHLLDEAVLIRDILAGASGVKILVTSHEKLSLEVENLYRLDGLALPSFDNPQGPEAYDSVKLFLLKAAQARPGFSLNPENAAAIVRICRLVDGNALGILLAASWVEHFSPSEIAEQASRGLDFLAVSTRDAEPRHSSMRLVLQTSFDRLDEAHREIFRKLSIFGGGFDLAAAQAVAGADLQALLALAEKSLLSRDPESARYELHGLLRQFTSEELAAAGERQAMLRTHADYFVAFVRERLARVKSSSQATALDEIQADLDNIRQAWTTVIGSRDCTSAREMLPTLYAFCDMRSRFYEGEAMFRQAVDGLAPLAGEAPSPAWALALLSWFDMRNYFEPFESLESLAAQAKACLVQAVSDNDSQAASASQVLLGAIAEQRGEHRTAVWNYEAAMHAFPSLDDIYWVNMRIGICHQANSDYAQAIQAFRRSLQRGLEIGERVKTGWSLLNLGETLLLQAEPSEAEQYLEQSRTLFTEVGTTIGVLWSLYGLSRAALDRGELGHARDLASTAAELARQVHSASWARKTNELLRRIDPGSSHPPPSIQLHPDPSLSQRELEVLRFLKSDMTGPEIARALVVSLNTVRYHTKHIYQKLGANSRLEAIRRAHELGL